MILELLFLPITAAVLGAAFLAAAPTRYLPYVAGAAWVALLVGAVLVYAKLSIGVSSGLALASLAAAVAAPTSIETRLVRAFAAAACGCVSLGLGIGAVVFAANTYYEPAPVDPNLILYAGQWSLLGAALAAALASAGCASVGDSERAVRPAGLGVVAGCAVLGALLIGNIRATLPSQGFALDLSTASGEFYWALPEAAGGAHALGLPVTLEVPMGNEALGACLVAIVLSMVLGAWTRSDRRVVAGAWAVSSVLALASVAVIVRAGKSGARPVAQPYAEHAKAIAAERKIPKQLLEQAGFIEVDQVFVLWIDILPELVALTIAALVCAVAAVLVMRVYEPPSARTTRIGILYGRDLAVRSAALAWMGWLMGQLVNWRVHAVYGFASAHEFTSLGVVLVCAGLAWLHWSVPERAKRLIGAAIAGALILGIALALANGMVFGVSVRT